VKFLSFDREVISNDIEQGLVILVLGAVQRQVILMQVPLKDLHQLLILVAKQRIYLLRVYAYIKVF
jgi:hypothetical protein